MIGVYSMDNILFQSFQNVRKVVENSIKLLRDADALMSDKGYIPILGNGLATETSKSILQTPDSYNTLIPQYMARPYGSKLQLESNKLDHLLIINVQFTHPLHEQLIPSIAAGKLAFEHSTENIRNKFKPWFMKYAIYEADLKIDLFNETLYMCNPFIDSDDKFTFSIKPLSTIQSNNDVIKIVEDMCKL